MGTGNLTSGRAYTFVPAKMWEATRNRPSKHKYLLRKKKEASFSEPLIVIQPSLHPTRIPLTCHRITSSHPQNSCRQADELENCDSLVWDRWLGQTVKPEDGQRSTIPTTSQRLEVGAGVCLAFRPFGFCTKSPAGNVKLGGCLFNALIQTFGRFLA
jgi:hypothetical protein